MKLFFLYILAAFSFASLGAELGGMILPGSPLCKEGPTTSADVAEWKTYSASQAPSWKEIHDRLPAETKDREVVAHRIRNQYITSNYVRLCWDRVLDGGKCQRAPDLGFIWTCAASYGSQMAGSYLVDAINQSKKDDGFLGNGIKAFTVKPAINKLGEANTKIYDDVAWHYFAAAKCGTRYAEQLLASAVGPFDQRYAKYWSMARTQASSANPNSKAVVLEMLYLEQERIQPELYAARLILGQISEQNGITSGVAGASFFKTFTEKHFDRPIGGYNLADFSQRLTWQGADVIPRVHEMVMAPDCSGTASIQRIGQLASNQQSGLFESYPSGRMPGAYVLDLLAPEARSPSLAASDANGPRHNPLRSPN